MTATTAPGPAPIREVMTAPARGRHRHPRPPLLWLLHLALHGRERSTGERLADAGAVVVFLIATAVALRLGDYAHTLGGIHP